MLGFGLQVLYQPPELWQMAKEVQPTTMVYFQPGEAKDVPIRPELTIGRKYYKNQLYHLQNDPTAFGQQLAHDAIASARTNNIEYWVGPTEPPVASPEECARLVACEKARAEILNANGLKAVVFYLSVGWPLENVADHTLYTGQFDAFLRQLPTQNLVGLNEYFLPPNGPLHPDSYDPDKPSRIWRFRHWPGIDRHKIFITECGMDIGGNSLTDGWMKQCPVGMNLEEWFDVYVEWMGQYLNLISQDDRVIGAAWFCGGPGYSWGDYDVLPYWRKAKPLFEGPVPEVPPIDIPPSSKTIRVLVEWPDEKREEVVQMSLETYVEGVLPAELSAQQLRFPNSPECLDVASKNPTCPYTTQTTHMEALRAMAVLIRSVALARIDSPRDIGYNVNNSDQIYRPWMGHERTDDVLYARAIQAVADTKGYYLTRNGQHYYASYVNGCGRNICSWCEGEGGYKNKEWAGRACQFGLQFMARSLGAKWQELALHYYEDDVVLVGGIVPPMEPVIEPTPEEGDNDMFRHNVYIDKFIKNPGTNDAADKGVVVEKDVKAEARVIGVHCLTSTENYPDHHVLLAVVDKDGKRVDGTQVDWEWKHMDESERPNPVWLDKPEGEPPGNLPIFGQMEITVRVKGMKSDSVSGLSTMHDGGDGEVNRRGHFSYFVVWQTGGESVPEPIPVPPIPVPPEPIPAPGNLDEIRRKAREVYAGMAEVIGLLDGL